MGEHPAAIAAWKAADPTHRNNAIVYPYSGTLWEASQTVTLDNFTPSVKKFDDPTAQFGPTTSTRDLFMARLGETYLIAAEAYFKSATPLLRLNGSMKYDAELPNPGLKLP